MRIRRTIVTAGLESGDSAGDERGVTRADECCVQLSFTEPALGGPGRNPFPPRLCATAGGSVRYFVVEFLFHGGVGAANRGG